eukprot:3260526-Prymnesium_polylepis.2
MATVQSTSRRSKDHRGSRAASGRLSVYSRKNSEHLEPVHGRKASVRQETVPDAAVCAIRSASSFGGVETFEDGAPSPRRRPWSKTNVDDTPAVNAAGVWPKEAQSNDVTT